MSEVPGVATEVDQDQMDVDAAAPEETVQLGDKITILPGHAADMSAATFCLKEEDHTLGNSLRYMLMKNPQVEFCGYSNPHPSEAKIHLRVQMYDHKSALAALSSAIRHLEDLFQAIAESYSADLERNEYEKYSEEDKTGTSRLREIVERGREIEAEKNAADKAGLVLP